MKAGLPRLNAKAWGIIWGLIVVACVCIGISTRMSFTNYDDQGESLLDMRYLYAPASSEVVGLTSETAASRGMVDIEGLVSDTPVIVSGIFEGHRSYAYQSFVSDVKVTQVYRGNGVEAGQTIPIFEAAGVGEMRASSGSGGQKAIRPTAGALLYGCTMMAPGQEYLFFLFPKEYPASMNREGMPQEYVIQNNPYARLAMCPDGMVEDVGIFKSIEEPLSLRDLQDYSFIVLSEDDRSLYCETRRSICERVNGF